MSSSTAPFNSSRRATGVALAFVIVVLLSAAHGAEASPPPCPLPYPQADCVSVSNVAGAASTDAYGSFPYGQYPMQSMPAATPWTTLPAAEGWHLHVPAYNTIGSVDLVIHNPTTGAIEAQLPSVAYSPTLGPGDYDLGTTLQLPAGLANGPHELDVDVNDSYYYVQPDCCGGPPTVYSGVWTYQVQKWLRVDADPPQPARSSTVVGGDGWHASPQLSVGLTKPNEDPATESPISAVRYELCPATDRGHCGQEQRVAVDPNAAVVAVSVAPPRPGDYLVKAWFEDAATNRSPVFDNDDAHVRYDPDPPRLDGFAADDPSDPTDIEVPASDATSGIASGEIDYQVIGGSSTWHELETSATQSGLAARVDDSRVPKGQLRFRAVATDLAGNAAATMHLVGGTQDFVLRVPLRQATRMGISARRTLHAIVKRCHRSGGHRRCVTTFRPPRRRQPSSLNLSFGRRKRLHGLLTTDQGRPIAGAALDIVMTPEIPGAMPSTVTVHTNHQGQFSYVVPAGPSRALTVSYGGGTHLQPTDRRLRAMTRGQLTLNAHPTRIHEPGSVELTGRVHGGPLPRDGKLVSLQIWNAHRWQTFTTVHTDADGRFRYVKAIEHSPAGTYRLRATLPREAAFPYAGGSSRVARIHVR